MWKLSKEVDERLNDETKLEIAVWLVGVQVSKEMEGWQRSWGDILDRLFGKKHFSFRCFLRSFFASCLAFLLSSVFTGTSLFDSWTDFFIELIIVLLVTSIPDYLALLQTRRLLKKMTTRPASKSFYGGVLVLGVGVALISCFLSLVCLQLLEFALIFLRLGLLFNYDSWHEYVDVTLTALRKLGSSYERNPVSGWTQ